MKTDTITLSLQNPRLEKLVQERRTSINQQAIKDAHMHAESGKPLAREKSSKPYTATYSAQWLDLRTEGLQDIQPEAHTAKIRHAISAANTERVAIKARVTELEHENRIAKYKLDGEHISGLLAQHRKGLISVAVLSIAEVAFNSWSLQILGDSLLLAFFVAVGIALGSGWLARGIVDFLSKRRELGRKAYLIAGGLCAVALSGFAGLSLLRSQATATESSTISPWFFFSINLFFFVATAIICYKYFPKGNEEAQNTWRMHNDAIERRQKDIDRLHKELKAVVTTLNEHVNQYLHITSLAQHFTERINSLHRETIEQYRNTNLIARKDQLTPESFHETVPDLPAPPTIPPIDLNFSE